MSCKILTKLIDREKVKGIMLFVTDSENDTIPSGLEVDLYKKSSICYLTFHLKIDEDLAKYNNITVVVLKHQQEFHDDYEEVIEALYQNINDILIVKTMIGMVENFIKETIISRSHLCRNIS